MSNTTGAKPDDAYEFEILASIVNDLRLLLSAKLHLELLLLKNKGARSAKEGSDKSGAILLALLQQIPKFVFSIKNRSGGREYMRAHWNFEMNEEGLI